jgi:hypothetical protein
VLHYIWGFQGQGNVQEIIWDRTEMQRVSMVEGGLHGEVYREAELQEWGCELYSANFRFQ